MAGTWTALSHFKARTENMPQPVIGIGYEFTADASAATVPDKVTEEVSGALAAIAVVYDGTTPPDATTVTVKDMLGVTIATEALTASGYIYLERPLFFVPGPLTISVANNTTNSAKAKVILVLI